MQLSKVTPISAKNLIPVYGVESKVKVQQIKPKATTNFFSSNEDAICLIATRAYYKAEARGFEPGHEMDDWLAAEAEVNK